MAQLMPLPLTVSCFSKIQIVLPFWYRLTQVFPEKGPLNVCACVRVCMQMTVFICVYVYDSKYLEFCRLSQFLDVVVFLQICFTILVAVKFLQNDSEQQMYQQRLGQHVAIQ